MYLKILLIISITLFSCSVYATDDFSLDTNTVWGNIKGYGISVLQKASDIWNSRLKPWGLDMLKEFKSFFDKERIDDEFKKELSEAREGVMNIFEKVKNR